MPASLEPPQTLQDYYDQSKKLKSAGIVDAPFLGFWGKDVLEHYLITYLLLSGITPFDDKGEPVFADDPPPRTLMAWWQTMYQEGLVQQSAFTDDPGKLISQMVNAQGAFWIVDHYVMKNIVEAAGPASAEVKMVAPVGGDLKTLQFGEVIQMGGALEGEAQDAAWNAHEVLRLEGRGGRVHDVPVSLGEGRQPARAVSRCLRRPGSAGRLRRLHGPPAHRGGVRLPVRTTCPPALRRGTPAFGTTAAEVLQKLILGQVEPKDAVTPARRRRRVGQAGWRFVTLSVRERANRRFGRALTAPAVVLVVVLIAIPAVLMLDQSLRRVPANGASWGDFIGFDNYQVVLTSPVMWRSVLVTVIFAVGFVALATLVGLLAALLLNERFAGRWFVRAILVIPWACPWLIAGILWKWFIDGDLGGLNALLMLLGIIHEYIDFLANPTLALIMTIVAAAWRQASW